MEAGLVWILCPPRSGSTWLLNLMRFHPRVVAIDEPLVGAHLGVTREHLIGRVTSMGCSEPIAKSESGRASYLLSREYEDVWRPALRNLVLGRLGAEIGSARGTVGVVKEPHGADAAEFLVDLLPNSRVLFLLRDGRDVVDSVLDAALTGWNGGDPSAASAELRMAIVEEAAGRYVQVVGAVQAAYDRLPESQRLVVRYEHLRAGTANELRRIHQWIGLDATDADREYAADKLAFERIPADQRGSGKFARAATPGFWRKNLRPQEQDKVHEIMASQLARYGYAV